MSKLERYPAYKESGVEWLGEIPEGWEIQKLKFNANNKTIKSVENDFKIALENIESQTTKYIETKEIVFSEAGINFKKGDVLFGKLRPYLAKVYLAEQEGLCVSEFLVLESKNIMSKFLKYMLVSYSCIEHINSSTYGTKMPRASWNFIGNSLVPVPQQKEQTKIASFLDEKTAQIDKAISQKEKLIELLKERRQIVINEAVTKGFDKDVEFKDSGVEWIGKIPKHWEVIRSKRLFQQRKDRARKGDRQLTASQKYGVIFQDKFMKLEGRKVTQVEHNYEILKRAEKGDFLISMRSFQGGIEYCRETGSVSSAYVALIPIKHVVPEYFKYLLKSQKYIKALSSTSNLVRDGQALRFENFSIVDLLVIPKDEQVQIAEYIDKQTSKIDKAIELQQNYIAKFKEYKASLIDSVVTGKVRVA